MADVYVDFSFPDQEFIPRRYYHSVRRAGVRFSHEGASQQRSRAPPSGEDAGAASMAASMHPQNNAELCAVRGNWANPEHCVARQTTSRRKIYLLAARMSCFRVRLSPIR
jgi:hypothetical protein